MSSSSPLRDRWPLDPAVDYLTHGTFGACPHSVLAVQAELRAELERGPLAFMVRRAPALLDAARERLADFLGADPEGLVPMPNATTGVSTVLRSLAPTLRPGDELLTTDHEYNACRNALEHVAGGAGARVVVARVPFPCPGPEAALEAVLAVAGPHTRLALLDHVTSPTGLVMPLGELVAALAGRGIDTLVDGAHAPGMLPLEVERLGAAWYTGNCHKWLCAPKGAGFLWVRGDRRDAVRPLVISHGFNVRRPGRSRLHDEFDWTGTGDPTPFLSVPAALDTLAAMVPGGWPEVMRRNRELALAGRAVVAASLGVAPPCPESMAGSLASLVLPDAGPGELADPLHGGDPLQEALAARFAIEVPVFSWPSPPRRLIRISAQLYNDLGQYRRLAAALAELLPRG
jgi:isopenicillin-N epimerase